MQLSTTSPGNRKKIFLRKCILPGVHFRKSKFTDQSGSPPGSALLRKEDRITAVWTVGKAAKVSLKTSGSISGFYDANGKQLRQELAGHYIRVAVSNHLLYLVGSLDLEVEIPEK